MHYAKYIAILWVVLFAIHSGYTHYQTSQVPTIDTLRAQTEEARQREEQARRDRETREDAESKAIYLECFHSATTQTGSRFDEQQKNAYECWKTNTNWTGKLAPSSEPPSRPIISKTSQNVSNQSTVWYTQTKTSSSWSEVQPTGKAQWKWVGTSVQGGWKVPRTQAGDPNGKTVSKGKEADYWLAYETAIKLIRKWEWYAPVSKWDVKQCSGWYGHKAPCGMKISKQQADKWLADDTHSWLSQVIKDFPKLHPEAQWSLASFRHNCPAGYSSVRKNGLKYFNSWCKVSKDKNGNILPEYTRWLTNRRAEEWKIISSK